MAIESPNQPVTKTIKLDLDGISDSGKVRAKNEIGRILIEEIQDHLDRSTSPVAGGAFKKKKADGSSSILLDFGDMRDAIEFRDNGDDEIEIGIFNRSETAKAYAHNTGFKGHPFLESDALRREFIPDEGATFKRSITRKVDEVIEFIRFSENAVEEGSEPITENLFVSAFGGKKTLGQVLKSENISSSDIAAFNILFEDDF